MTSMIARYYKEQDAYMYLEDATDCWGVYALHEEPDDEGGDYTDLLAIVQTEKLADVLLAYLDPKET